jgi:hypothetical protein
MEGLRERVLKESSLIRRNEECRKMIGRSNEKVLNLMETVIFRAEE